MACMTDYGYILFIHIESFHKKKEMTMATTEYGIEFPVVIEKRKSLWDSVPSRKIRCNRREDS